MNVPIWIITRLQQRDRQNSQNWNNDTFSKLPERYAQIKEAFGASTKDDILQIYISHQDFRASNVRADDVDYNLYVFDIKYQQNFTASQPIKVEFKFDGIVPNAVNRYALVLTNKLVSISSDGQRHFDLV